MNAPAYLGLLLVGAGFVIALREIRFLRRAKVVEGKVVHIDKFQGSHLGEGSPQEHHWPVIEFSAASGQPRRIVDPIYKYRRKGDRVRVAVPPDAPHKARVYSIIRFWGPAAVLIVAGIAAFLSS